MSGQCDHDYVYLGLQWWDDERLMPGGGATTIAYVNTFFCKRCLAKVFERTDMTHSSYVKKAEGSTPVSRPDAIALRRG